MKIYTRSGDNMETDVLGGRVRKDHEIIECLGTIDELSSSLMMAFHNISLNQVKNDVLMIVQDLRSLAVSIMDKKSHDISLDTVIKYEKTIDIYEKVLKPITGFILPGETLAGSYLHFSRTIARRLERLIVKYSRKNKINNYALQYINRMSDLLFVMARFVEEK